MLPAGCARPPGRARIGTVTSDAVGDLKRPCVAPGLRVGRGLERFLATTPLDRHRGVVAPGLRVGRGLEPHVERSSRSLASPTRCARPPGRARIGTRTGTHPRRRGFCQAPCGATCCARPPGRARIGTSASSLPVPARRHQRLRPASGSGEDWNKSSRSAEGDARYSGCARPPGRARIGTGRPA